MEHLAPFSSERPVNPEAGPNRQWWHPGNFLRSLKQRWNEARSERFETDDDEETLPDGRSIRKGRLRKFAGALLAFSGSVFAKKPKETAEETGRQSLFGIEKPVVPSTPEPVSAPETVTVQPVETISVAPEAIEAPLPVSPTFSERAAAESIVAPFRTVEARTPATHTTERVIESPGLAAVVGIGLIAETIGRRRADSKIKKEVKRLKKEDQSHREVAGRLDHEAQTVREELRAVKFQQQAFEKRFDQPKIIRETTAGEPVEIKTPEPGEKPVIEKLPMAEQVVHQAAALNRPESVLERVEVAADQNIPVEAAYERRHEAKDQTAQRRINGTLSSSGSNGPVSLSKALEERLAAVRQKQARDADSMPASQSGKLTRPPSLYKNATVSGLWGAVILLLFIAILFLMAPH